MSDVTQILHQIENGDPSAAEDLLPMIYEELRRTPLDDVELESPASQLDLLALDEALERLTDENPEKAE